jgi:hypothetical protein
MFSVPDLLDRAKKGAGVESDYALAKLLGHRNQANVSGWRNERTAPDERAIQALCKLSGDDPEYVAAMIQGMRAANDDAAGLWRRVAERLKGGVGAVMVATVALLALSALDLSPTAQAASASAPVIVMSNVLRRFLMNVIRAVFRRNAPPTAA